MNPDSLCAKCAHLIKSTTLGIVFHYCKHRNSIDYDTWQRLYNELISKNAAKRK